MIISCVWYKGGYHPAQFVHRASALFGKRDFHRVSVPLGKIVLSLAELNGSYQAQHDSGIVGIVVHSGMPQSKIANYSTTFGDWGVDRRRLAPALLEILFIDPGPIQNGILDPLVPPNVGAQPKLGGTILY